MSWFDDQLNSCTGNVLSGSLVLPYGGCVSGNTIVSNLFLSPRPRNVGKPLSVIRMCQANSHEIFFGPGDFGISSVQHRINFLLFSLCLTPEMFPSSKIAKGLLRSFLFVSVKIFIVLWVVPRWGKIIYLRKSWEIRTSLFIPQHTRYPCVNYMTGAYYDNFCDVNLCYVFFGSQA